MNLVRLAAIAALSASLAQATTQLSFTLKLNEEVLAQDSATLTTENSVAFGTAAGLTLVAQLVEEADDAAILKFEVAQDDKVVCTPEISAAYGKEAVVTCQGADAYELTISVDKVAEVIPVDAIVETAE
jgi:hypothetical protein